MSTQIDAMTRQQAPQPPQPRQPEVDVNQLDNASLLEYIGQTIAQPILQQLVTLSVHEELRDVQSEYSDFKDFKNDVYQACQTNPHLSIKQAYLMVKGGKPIPPPPAPVPPPAPPTPGDKGGGIPPSAASEHKQLSIRDAAAAAMKDLQFE
jgi:hypothetical protein